MIDSIEAPALFDEWGWFALSVLAVATLTLSILKLAGAGLGALPLVAVLRAAVQLTLVALLLQGALALPWVLVLFVLLMLSTASWTAGHRIRGVPGGVQGAALGVVSGSMIALGTVMLLRMVPPEPQQMIAIAGITIGTSMSVATLSLRHYRTLVKDRAGEVEAWLALGATTWQATREVRREAVGEAMIPNLDQTKSTGLVTLPGAFVGALFAGLDPLEAARFQLVVLASLGLSASLTAVIGTRWAARSAQLPLN